MNRKRGVSIVKIRWLQKRLGVWAEVLIRPGLMFYAASP
jgi:hypothetical protein